MNWNKSIRQLHRWLSIIFTVTVIANFATMTAAVIGFFASRNIWMISKSLEALRICRPFSNAPDNTLSVGLPYRAVYQVEIQSSSSKA